ncbi:MAG: DUF3048 domain-containing protein [Candidatus Actinomarina sp.]|nr:DUF3048 domain-containing protein [Candidatus Actinomarina sp.]MBL6763077.1 DUF3048 domain-containing protein [Candidatus Actinomarina sp.]
MKKVTILVIALVFVTCSTTSDETSSVEITSTTTASVTTVQQSNESSTTTEPTIEYVFDVEKMSPFTGKELPPETWLKRPKRVISFKIDNNINARPQSGLQEADAVHEILVEGGMTRFLAFFYDNTSKYLGPIRSARPTDPTMVRPYGGTLVVSGATAGLIPSIRELGVPVLEEQSSPVMFRISSRNAPHNLYADTELVRQTINSRGFYFLQPGPGPLYPFGLNQNNWSDGANKITIKYSEFTSVIWKLDGDRYSRFIIDNYSVNKEATAHNFISQDGNYSDILKTETIVVIQGPLYKDKATTLPSVLTVGVGNVYVFNQGKYIEGTWRRGDITDPFDLTDINGNDIQVPPSTQWVHILPNEGIVSVDQ